MAIETSPIAIGHFNEKFLNFSGNYIIFVGTCKLFSIISKSCGIYSTTPSYCWRS